MYTQQTAQDTEAGRGHMVHMLQRNLGNMLQHVCPQALENVHGWNCTISTTTSVHHCCNI